jgi:Domain of unknown function (DUF1707)
MATGPDLRIGHAEREAAAASLREHYAQGRLTLEEFNERLDATFKAVTQRELNRITEDLPHAARPSTALPVTTVPGGGRQDWSQGRHHHRLGIFPLTIAALCSWLLFLLVLFDLHLRAFPWPGKLAIFLAIFGVIRGVLRRLFGLGGRGRVPGRGRPGRPGRGRGRYPGGPWSGI